MIRRVYICAQPGHWTNRVYWVSEAWLSLGAVSLIDARKTLAGYGDDAITISAVSVAGVPEEIFVICPPEALIAYLEGGPAPEWDPRLVCWCGSAYQNETCRNGHALNDKRQAAAEGER